MKVISTTLTLAALLFSGCKEKPKYIPRIIYVAPGRYTLKDVELWVNPNYIVPKVSIDTSCCHCILIENINEPKK